MSARIRALLWVLGVVTLFVDTPSQTHAQVLYGSIVGSVKDQSGAIVPGASVTATETGTNTTLTAKVGSDGTYTLANAPAGFYTVKITKEGFETFIAEHVGVSINTTTRVEGTLNVGATSETVTVQTSSTELQTDRADVHEDVSSQELLEIPTPVRSYQGLLGTLPGSSPLSFGGGGTNNPTKSMAVGFNGSAFTNTDFRIEGVSASDAWAAFDSTARPSIEAIQTVNVVSGTADVEQGLNSGATVSIQLKSGSNDLHGSAYWYHTDQDLAARYYTAAPGSKKNKAIENDLGGTVGGPILKNKLFYFVSYEGDFTRTGAPAIGTVPLPSVKAGNFQTLLSQLGNPDPTNPTLCNPASGTAAPCIFDPTTGTARGSGRTPFFATTSGATANPECQSGVCYNMIPVSSISSINSKLLALIPAPNTGGTNAIVNNFLGSSPQAYNLSLVDGKVDWNATSKLRISIRGAYDPYSDTSGALFGNTLGDGSTFTNQHGFVNAFTGSFTYISNPTFVIDGGFGFTRSNQLLLPIDAGSRYTRDTLGIPGTNLGNLPFAGGLATQTIGCSIFYDQTFCGAQYTKYGEGYDYLQYLDPVFTYFSNFTKISGKHSWKFGFNLINTHMNHVETGPDAIAYDGGVTSDNDANQPYHVSSGTGNLYSSFADFVIGAPTGWYTHELNAIGGQKMTQLRIWGDSAYFGDTWKPTTRLTIAYGTGWEYYPVPTHGNHGMEIFLPQPGGTGIYEVCGFGSVAKDCGIKVSNHLFTPRFGFAFRPTNNLVVRGGYGISIDQYNMARNSILNTPEILNYANSTGFTNPYFPVGSLSVGVPVPASPDYSTGIISPLPAGFNLGNISANIPVNYTRGYVQSYNFTIQKTFGAWSAQAGFVGNHAVHTYALTDMNYCSVGDTSPNCEKFHSVFGGQSTSMISPIGNMHYNGLQTILMRSFANGYMLSANYTYAKVIGICCNSVFGPIPISDPNYIHLNRAIEPNDQTHVFNLTGVAQSPFGKGKMFMKDGGVAAEILGGWQLNGALVMRTGQPLTISDGSISSGNNQFASYASGVTRKTVAYPKTMAQWFNPHDFVAASSCSTCFGNVGLDSLRGPGAKNLDLSLFRDIPVREQLKAQIKVEAFNVTNTPHWANPNTDISSPALGMISNVAPVNRLVDQRFLRLGLRFQF
jgi:hypothetical protein